MELTRTSHHLQNLHVSGAGRSPATSPLTSGMLDLSKIYHQNPFFSNVHNSVFSEMSPFSIQALNMNSRLGLLPPNFFSASTGPAHLHANNNMNGTNKRNYSGKNHDESFEGSDNFYGAVDVPSPKKRKINDDSGNENEDERQQLSRNYPHPLNSSGSEASNGDGDGDGDGDGNSTSRRNSNKRPIPDEQKDVKYFERRRRNNLAAKKSRDARKTREDHLALRVAQLEKENAIFRAQVALLREEMGVLHLYLIQKNNGNFIPPKHSPPSSSSPPPASSLSPTTSLDLHLPRNLSMSPQQEHSPRSKNK